MLPESPTTTRADHGGSKWRLGRLVLRIEKGPDAGKEVEVEASRATVGRSNVHDLVLNDHSVSNSHFDIELSSEGVLLRDLGSTNGTKVNGLRIREAWLEPGALVVAGNTSIRVQSADEVEVSFVDANEFGGLVGTSDEMKILFAQLTKASMTDLRVFLHGETGCGKELAARAIHDHSGRYSAPFVVMDCGALSAQLAESEILGHKKGAFTGATADRAGKFEEANGGTLFIDEIGELPLELQPKLLRVLDRGEVIRVGENKVREVNVRVVSATHRDLRRMAGDGTFREDLYYRLAMATLELPPLRKRGDDVVRIAEHFVKELSEVMGKSVELGAEARAALRAYEWPGNVRELRNAMEVAVSWADDGEIGPDHVRMGQQDVAPPPPAPEQKQDQSLAGLFDMPLKQSETAFKRLYLTRVLELCGWNNAEAGEFMGYTREGVRGLRRKLGIDGPDGSA